MRKPKKRIFIPGGPKINTSACPNALSTKFKNTRITLLEDKEFGPEGHKEHGNIFQFVRAQETDIEAYCLRKKLRVLNGKATTICEIGLTDEALEAMYIMLRVRFEGIPKEWRKKSHPLTDEQIQEATQTI